ncbi:MAG TPA: transposase [Paludibacter sp.]|jgi:transposase-like protein|nr:transposase [Paludibacter sp.]HPM10771.1 transposase [Paludibacter sp.]
MANLNQLKLSVSERQRRRFSDSFKLQKVREIETGQTKVSEICSQYQVTSAAIYRWIDKFGIMKDKKERLVVESESDTRQLIELKKRLSELERIIGQKQIQIDFQNKMIELAEETYGVDIKKKFFTPPFDTSGRTEKS